MPILRSRTRLGAARSKRQRILTSTASISKRTLRKNVGAAAESSKSQKSGKKGISSLPEAANKKTTKPRGTIKKRSGALSKAAKPKALAAKGDVKKNFKAIAKVSKAGKSKPLGMKRKRAAIAVAGTVDSGVPKTHQHLGLRLDARLAFVDPSVNSDKYYVLQVLDGGPNVHWVWTRWGRTGHDGTGKLQGPLSLAAATKLFEQTFREKTGVSHADAVSGAAVPVQGKYWWLDTAGDVGGPAGSWEYYVDDGVDGKAVGWCVCPAAAAQPRIASDHSYCERPKPGCAEPSCRHTCRRGAATKRGAGAGTRTRPRARRRRTSCTGPTCCAATRAWACASSRGEAVRAVHTRARAQTPFSALRGSIFDSRAKPDGPAPRSHRCQRAQPCHGLTAVARRRRSGHFTYRVDLTDPAGNYTQQNLDVPPNKIRRIRRVVH